MAEAGLSGQKLLIQVCYALPEIALLIDIEVEQGATLEQAIQQSGLLAKYPEIDLAVNKTGVFGKLRKLSELARAGDRIEIYRPLQADPMESRRRRAKHKARSG